MWLWCMINKKTGEKMNVKDKTTIGIISAMAVIAFVLLFGFVFGNIDPKNKLEAYTLAISFAGLFATFGGAYLGAKISANTAIKLARQDRNVENSAKMLANLSKINHLSEILKYKVMDNKLLLEKLEKDGGHHTEDLKELKTEYTEWQKYYSDLTIYINSTELNSEDIKGIKEPTCLLAYLEDNIERFTYSDMNNEGRSNKGVEKDELDEVINTFELCNEYLLKIEKQTNIIREKLINQLPK